MAEKPGTAKSRPSSPPASMEQGNCLSGKSTGQVMAPVWTEPMASQIQEPQMTLITKTEAAALRSHYPSSPHYKNSSAQCQLTSRYGCSSLKPCGCCGCAACAEASIDIFEVEALRSFREKPDFTAIKIWAKDWEHHISSVDRSFIGNIMFDLIRVLERAKLTTKPWLAHVAIHPCVDGMQDYYTFNSYLLTTQLRQTQRHALCEAVDDSRLIDGAGMNNYDEGQRAIHNTFPPTCGTLDYKNKTYVDQLATISVFDMFFSMNCQFLTLA